MTRQCERPGCSALASVSYGFEATAAVVWLDRFADEPERQLFGVLCRRHADALRPPRGWWLDDRRVATPRLFTVDGDTEVDTVEGEAAPVEPPVEPVEPVEAGDGPVPPAPPPSSRRRRTVPHTELSFDFGDDSSVGDPPDPSPQESTEPAAAPDPSAHAPVAERAATQSSAQDPGPAAHAEAAHDPDETVAMPWTPVFDRADDLNGVLSARSPLLARAFGLRRQGS